MPKLKPSQSTIETAAGEKAFGKLETKIKALATEALVPVNVDVQVAALLALGVARDVESDTVLQGRFEALAKTGELDVDSLNGLADAALAAWFTRHKLLLASATHTEAQLPVSLVTKASELKTRMMRVADYHLGDHEVAGPLVGAIRSGVGYLDMANDLIALAKLYSTYRSQLSLDRKDYVETDEKLARDTGDRILELLGASGTPDARKWTDLQARAFSLLSKRYGDVQAAGRFLLRAQVGAGEERFPSLVAGSRAAASKSAKTDAPTAPGPVAPSP